MAGDSWKLQSRDRLGQWAGGFARRVSTGRAENIADRRRGKLAAGDRRRTKAIQQSDIREVRDLYAGRADTVSGAVRKHVEYTHPRLAREAVKTTGRNQKPLQEALESVRGRRGATGRTVAANPFSGRIVAQPSQARLSERRASAARAVAAKKPRAKLAPKQEYVGRRRADP